MAIDIPETGQLLTRLCADAKARGPAHAVQRLFCPGIIVSRGSHESADPYDLILSNVEFVNAMTGEAQLLPGEFPIEALCSYYADYYFAQVSNGGHGQFAANSGLGYIETTCAAMGLKYMGAAGHLELLVQFMEIMKGADTARAAAIAKGAGFGDIDAAVGDLDNRFHALERVQSMVPIHNAWLRSLPSLNVVPDQEIPAILRRIGLSNPLREVRQAEAARHAEEERSKDPRYQLFARLCAEANLRPLGWWPTQGIAMKALYPDCVSWSVTTNAGDFHAVFRRRKGWFGPSCHAFLLADVLKGNSRGRQIATTPISKAEYLLMQG